MKKGILLFAASFITATLFAQTNFGIRGGLSSSRMQGDALTSFNDIIDLTGGRITTSSRNGFFAGGYVYIPVGKQFSVEPALYYSQKGYELNGALQIKEVDFLNASAKAKLDARYIDLPVLLKANMGGLQLFAGPQVSYLVHANLQARAGVFGINLMNQSWDVSDQYNRWDAGLTGGIGYQFKNGLNVSAAYEHGLSRLDQNQSMEAYNRSFKVGLGMTF